MPYAMFVITGFDPVIHAFQRPNGRTSNCVDGRIRSTAVRLSFGGQGHGIDFDGSGRFTDDPDTRRGISAMRHQNSVFHELLKHLPWGEFDRLVSAHQADLRVRRLTTKSQFVALLYGQLAGATSLRDIVTGLQSHQARLYHLGARPVQRSTLADANARRPRKCLPSCLR